MMQQPTLEATSSSLDADRMQPSSDINTTSLPNLPSPQIPAVVETIAAEEERFDKECEEMAEIEQDLLSAPSPSTSLNISLTRMAALQTRPPSNTKTAS